MDWDKRVAFHADPYLPNRWNRLLQRVVPNRYRFQTVTGSSLTDPSRIFQGVQRVLRGFCFTLSINIESVLNYKWGGTSLEIYQLKCPISQTSPYNTKRFIHRPCLTNEMRQKKKEKKSSLLETDIGQDLSGKNAAKKQAFQFNLEKSYLKTCIRHVTISFTSPPTHRKPKQKRQDLIILQYAAGP